MKRREFVRLAGSGMAATALAETLAAQRVSQSPKPAGSPSSASHTKVKFHVGTQHGDSDPMQGFAFAIGYLKAIIAAVYAEA